jgi:hypothetical protein
MSRLNFLVQWGNPFANVLANATDTRCCATQRRLPRNAAEYAAPIIVILWNDFIDPLLAILLANLLVSLHVLGLLCL